MRILFDQGTPVPLRRVLTQHEVVTAHERGWSQLNNGDLLNLAEIEGFYVLVTTDTNLKHQQNLVSRRIAIVALTTTSWPRMQRVLGEVVAAVGSATAGSSREVEIPWRPPNLLLQGSGTLEGCKRQDRPGRFFLRATGTTMTCVDASEGLTR